MWQFWKKEKDEKVHKIVLRNKTIFEFDISDTWDMIRVDYEYDRPGNVTQMIIYIENEGE